MPEIEILRVFFWPGDPDSYTVDDAGSQVMSETEASEFGLVELDNLGREYGVTRWSEATDPERRGYGEVSYVADKLLLIGWAEAPIARVDVERTYNERNGDRHPKVNIKVRSFTIPDGDAFAELADEFELDPTLAALDLTELRARVERHIEKHDADLFYFACEDQFEDTRDQAMHRFFPDHDIKIHTEGRSGGWLVVEGLPNADEWGPKQLGTWKEFVEFCDAQVADVPRVMAWHVLANNQEELAGRVVRVELTLTLSDEDLAEAGDDPTEWDWQDMLDLGEDSTVAVRRLP
jgi:hypothetical protein